MVSRKSDLTRSIMVIWVNFIQNELMVEIYLDSLVRAICKVIWVNLFQNELMVKIYYESLVRAICKELLMTFG